MSNTPKPLVLGIGNDILTDDAIGPRLVDTLAKDYPIPGVAYQTTTLGGLEIVEFIDGYEPVIFIDAIKTKDGIPGDVYEFTPDDFKETLHLTNLHDVSFLTALELGKTLELNIPTRIKIFAVEIIEDQVFSEQFTPPLQAKFPEIIREIHSEIKKFISG